MDECANLLLFLAIFGTFAVAAFIGIFGADSRGAVSTLINRCGSNLICLLPKPHSRTTTPQHETIPTKPLESGMAIYLQAMGHRSDHSRYCSSIRLLSTKSKHLT